MEHLTAQEAVDTYSHALETGQPFTVATRGGARTITLQKSGTSCNFYNFYNFYNIKEFHKGALQASRSLPMVTTPRGALEHLAKICIEARAIDGIDYRRSYAMALGL